MSENYLLRWQDIQKIFKPCGRSKAMRILHQVGITHRVGKIPYVSVKALRQYLVEHDNEIVVDWSC